MKQPTEKEIREFESYVIAAARHNKISIPTRDYLIGMAITCRFNKTIKSMESRFEDMFK